MSKNISIIGSGFAGLSTACYLAQQGHRVNVYEKNEHLGGRARVMKTNGYHFDMGPSWYWMPDVFDQFFESFGKKCSDYYELKRLSPSYRVYFGENDILDIPSNYEDFRNMFETIELGAGHQLDLFLEEAAKKYKVGMNDLVHTPCLSIFEFVNKKIFSNIFSIDLFQSFSNHIKKYFTHPKLIRLLEFPVLFLGAMPEETPALYSMMNYADIKLGTWYPMGGMGKIIDGMVTLAESLGVTFHPNAGVQKISVGPSNKCEGIVVNGKLIQTDIVVSAADYHHTEMNLLEDQFKNYSEKYWDSRVLAPSSLLFYLGVNKKINNLQHHNLFFDKPFSPHAIDIYKTPKWPEEPLFYVSCASKTDDSVAPEGKENLFILIPIAPNLNDDEETRAMYFEKVVSRLEKLTGESIKDYIEYKKSFCVTEFKNEYNSYKGNAYGLANTLMQTAVLKPKIKNKKISNLYYAGQLTVPGPGIPPCLISGSIIAKQIKKDLVK